MAKQPKNLTRKQKILLDKLDLDPADWLAVSESKYELVVCNRTTSEVKHIEKE